MQTKILLLPALAAICLGAPIPEPQVLGEGTTLSTRAPAHQTYTFVVPCYGAADCVPRTLTIAARDEPAFTIPAFSFPAVTRTNLVRDPQVLGSPTRTVIVGPTPPATTKTTSKKPTTTKKPSTTKKPTTTQKPSTTKKSTSTKRYSSTMKHPPRTVELEKRQSLGSPSREVLEAPTPPPSKPTPPTKPTSSVHLVTVTVTVTDPPPTTRVTSQGDGSSRAAPTTLVVPRDKRQVLGSPSRTVLVSPTAPASPPPPPPHPHPTWIKTVTVTVTHYPPPTTTPVAPTHVTSNTDDYYYPSRSTEVEEGITRTVSTTLVVPIDKRQTLGLPTQAGIVPATTTVDEYITTTKVSYVTVTKPTTVRTTVYQASDFSVTTTQRIISVSTATVRLPVTQTLTKSAISTLTTTTCTEKKTQYPISTTIYDSSPTGIPTGGPWDVTRTPSTTLTVPLKERQEFGGGIPTFSLNWNAGGEGEAAPTQTLQVNPRQVLGFPSRSFTFYGSLPTGLPIIPTDAPTATRSVL